ncbi:MAG: hypothetical protein KBS65_06940, partial [Prevotella sp.]|nr:hypothetical protein [Candidatus Equicola stercoris]
MTTMKHTFAAILVLLSFIVLPLSANRDWVKFTAKEANSKVLIDGSYKPSTFCIEWRVNGGKWTKKTEKSSPALTSQEVKLNNVGDVLEVRGQNPNGLNKNQGAVAFIKLKPSAGKVEVSGDIMTLIDTTEKIVTEIPNQYCFYRLFEGGICLTSAKNLRLPASTYSHCYMQMFSGCRLLEEGPDMSAITKIQAHACEKMFESCNSLKAMPAMPNLKFVGESGCNSMFGKAQYSCSSLETVPDLVAPYVADGSYQSMFSNCTKLKKAPKIYADIMHRNTCASMFNGCTSLTDVPDLEAQYLDDNCYNKMFYGCTALVNAPAIKATEIGGSYSGQAFNYITCMQDMFRGCSSLRRIEVYFAKWYWKYLEKEYPTSSWVNGVTETTEGVFSAPCALPDERGTSRIPNKWQYNCFKTLSFDVATNGGYWKDRKDDILRVLKLEDVTTPPTAGRNLSEFVKWNTQPDGTGEDWDAAHKLTESTTYYAIFKQTGTPKEHCIEYTDFSATTIRIDTARFPKDKFVLGPWTQNVKDLNYGPYRSKSRYAVHNNPEEVDPRTGGNLYTILPNGDPSVRLGNWENHCAERMTYTYTVPADKNILTLYYAAVLEDPKHDSKEQPRFTLGILDEDNDTIDAKCCSFNFIPQIDMEKEDPTWHAEGNVYWKEWTPVGVNLQGYIGQKVQIQLTTYDCAQGGHFGYAYFGLDCERPEISASSCGADADLTAPSGFTYRWYKEGEETTTLSTNQTFNPGKAGKGAGIYYCDLINLQNPDCKFGPLRAEVAAETPIAQFTINSQETKTEEGKEVDIITVSNTSYLKNDDGTTRPIDEEKTGFSWTVTDKNGHVVFSFSDKEPIIKLEKAGDFTINLVVSINSGSCESQPAETSVTVVRGQIKREEVAGTACADGTPTWEDSKSHPIVDAQGKTHFQL